MAWTRWCCMCAAAAAMVGRETAMGAEAPSVSRIELRAVPPPAKDQFGMLAFQMKAPWMNGWITLRYPETLCTSLGLHFIDHNRRDMPPLSMLDPVPRWQRNELTGEVRYEGGTAEGVEFFGRARPYEDEVVLEYRVKNGTQVELKGTNVQMCLSLAGERQLQKKNDVRTTHTWIDGKWTSFADTTPTVEEKGRAPWILMLPKPGFGIGLSF